MNNSFPKYRGYNDNNFASSQIPSNMYPENGHTNANPFGNFRPMSTNNQKSDRDNSYNFNQAFRKNIPMIEQINHANDGHLIHNNIAPSVLEENIVEYRINIDSRDRDTTAYKDPFHYKVTFNPPSGRIIRNAGRIRPNDTRIEGPPEPHILREFKNIKYVKLDNIILPRFSDIVETEEGWKVDTSGNMLIDDRFVILSIKEINNTFTFATNKHTQDSFGLVIPDRSIGTKFYSGIPYYGTKIYKNSNLGNITTLTIDFLDSYGTPIKVNNLDNTITDTTDARHPLNKCFQNHMSLLIGVIESEIAINTKFDN